VRAGAERFASLEGLLLPTLGAAVLVTVVPVLLALLVARRALRLPPVEAWGSMAGGMTSSAALAAVRRAADGNRPALSYSASYAVASVLVTVAGQVVVLLMR
jgi:putative transport protein